MPRQVPATTAFRVAKNTLGRMACMHAAPDDGLHQHEQECLLDDESLAADRMLRLLAAACLGDEDAVLGRLTDLTDLIDVER